MVKALVAVAVTVVEPPSETLLPLIVTALLTRPAFGKPVALVSTAEDGVPRAGVTNTGLVDNTTLPVPVEVVTPVPPRATERVPVVPATMGRPTVFTRLPDDGVPRAGVTSVGEFRSAFVAMAVEILLNSVLISVPLTIFSGSPDGSASLVAKLVLCV